MGCYYPFVFAVCPECRKEKIIRRKKKSHKWDNSIISRKKKSHQWDNRSQKLHNAQQITTILSIILVSVSSSHIFMLMGSVDSNIE